MRVNTSAMNEAPVTKALGMVSLAQATVLPASIYLHQDAVDALQLSQLQSHCSALFHKGERRGFSEFTYNCPKEDAKVIL